MSAETHVEELTARIAELEGELSTLREGKGLSAAPPPVGAKAPQGCHICEVPRDQPGKPYCSAYHEGGAPKAPVPVSPEGAVNEWLSANVFNPSIAPAAEPKGVRAGQTYRHSSGMTGTMKSFVPEATGGSFVGWWSTEEGWVAAQLADGTLPYWALISDAPLSLEEPIEVDPNGDC